MAFFERRLIRPDRNRLGHLRVVTLGLTEELARRRNRPRCEFWQFAVKAAVANSEISLEVELRWRMPQSV
jgi:hypothetical protein